MSEQTRERLELLAISRPDDAKALGKEIDRIERELAEARRCLREAITYCETRSTRGENVGSMVNESEYLRWARVVNAGAEEGKGAK